MVSLLLTDHHLSDDELVCYQSRIRGGARIEIDEETRNDLIPVIYEVRRVSGVGSRIPTQVHHSTTDSENLLTSGAIAIHRWISKRESVSTLLFHAWRTSLVIVLLLAILSAFQGDLVYLWNPFAFGAIIIGVGYSFASLLLGSANFVTRVGNCRFYLITVLLSVLVLYFVNTPSWLLPFAGLPLSPALLSSWAFTMGVLSSLRGDFDSVSK